MSIDFTLTPEIEQLRLRVRDFIERVVTPGEAKIGGEDKGERAEYLRLLLKMPSDAKEAGHWLPHTPHDVGGMRRGDVERAVGKAEAGITGSMVDIPAEGWNPVREVATMHGGPGHSEIRIEILRIPAKNMLGGRGQGHRRGQYRLGPARLAHCMRWIAQAETALDMM